MTEESIVEWLKMKNAIRTYSHDDIGSARLLSDIFNKMCRYNATASEWYEFNGKYWAIDLGGLKVRNMTKILAKALIKYAVSASEDDNKYLKYAATWNEHRKRNTIIQDARDLNFFKNEDCDIDLYILNCMNCVLVLHQDRVEFIKHDPDLLLTQIANVRYEPGRSCERWEKFVEEVMEGNQEKVRYLQKLFGICLTGDTRLEKMWFLFGSTTRNGKSTMIETISNLLGTYAVSVRAETLAIKNNTDSRTASPDIAKLAGKRLAVASEPQKRMALDVALLKSMTGRDIISARFLHQSEFQFTPCFKLICNTNYLPIVSDTTIFKSDRVQVISFDRHFAESEQDKTLKNKLSTGNALSGILNWCISGWLLFCKEGLGEPENIRAATVEYANSSDKMQNFINDCLVEKKGCNIAIKDLYEKYEEWCNDNGFHTENKRNFIDDVKSKNIYKASGTVNGKTVRNIIRGYDFASEDFIEIDESEPLPFD